MREADPADRQHHLRRQFFVAFEAAGGERVAYGFFDLALRGDADFLKNPRRLVLKVSSFMMGS